MKIGTFIDNPSDGTIYKKPLSELHEVYEEARQLGVEYVDLEPGLLNIHAPEDLKAFLDGHGLRVSSIYTPFDFNYLDNENVKSSIEKVKNDILLTKKMGASVIMIVPLVKKASEDSRFDLANCREAIVELLRAVAPFSIENGITPTIENFSLFTHPFSTIKDCKYILESVPGLKFVFDTANFVFVNDDSMSALEVFKDYIVHVHIGNNIFSNDNPLVIRFGTGFEGTAVGEGFLPDAAIIKRLGETGYDGALSIEIPSNYSIYERYKRSVEFIKGCLNA